MINLERRAMGSNLFDNEMPKFECGVLCDASLEHSANGATLMDRRIARFDSNLGADSRQKSPN